MYITITQRNTHILPWEGSSCQGGRRRPRPITWFFPIRIALPCKWRGFRPGGVSECLRRVVCAIIQENQLRASMWCCVRSTKHAEKTMKSATGVSPECHRRASEQTKKSLMRCTKHAKKLNEKCRRRGHRSASELRKKCCMRSTRHAEKNVKKCHRSVTGVPPESL